MAGLSESALREALRRGVISAEQMDQLQALGREEVRGPMPPERREVSIALVLYWAGTLAVLFGLGYFLVDRWKSLRPGGVLAVVVLYTLSFVLSSRFLSKAGHQIAGSLFALLAVAMAPIAMWSIESLAGVWPSATAAPGMPFQTDMIATIRWIPIELSAALAGLIALRRVRFSVLAVSVSLPFALAAVHVTPLVFDPWLDPFIWGWMALFASAALLAIGSEIDRRQRDYTDFAAFVYLPALVYAVIGITEVGGQTRAVPHSLPLVFILLFGLSIATRRGQFLLFAAAFLIGYLGFLAQDVFPTATGFMIVMVAAGATVILSTVAVQRRWPELARSFARDAEPRRDFRYRRQVYGGVLAIALILLAYAPVRARTLRKEDGKRMIERARLQAQQRRALRGRLDSTVRELDTLRRELAAPLPRPRTETPRGAIP